MFRSLYSFLFLVVAGCSTLEFYSRNNFTPDDDKYRSFNFTAASKQHELNVENRDLLIRLITRELEDRGYKYDPDPDFWINLDLAVKRELSMMSYTNEPGQDLMYDPDYGRTKSGSKIYMNTAGKLYIDLIDSTEQKIIWQGIATGPVQDRFKNAKSIFKVVKLMFREFPE